MFILHLQCSLVAHSNQLRNHHFQLVPLDNNFQLHSHDVVSKTKSVVSCAVKCAEYSCCVALSYNENTGDCILSSVYPEVSGRSTDSSASIYYVAGIQRQCSMIFACLMLDKLFAPPGLRCGNHL